MEKPFKLSVRLYVLGLIFNSLEVTMALETPLQRPKAGQQVNGAPTGTTLPTAPTAATATTPDQEQLKFEGDVIEGAEQSPQVLFTFVTEDPTLDLLIYRRKDFNDLHRGKFRAPFRYQAPQNPSR